MRIVVVAAGDPRSASLQFAHGDSVPRQLFAFRIHDANIHARKRKSVAGHQVEPLLLRQECKMALQERDRPDGSELGHAPPQHEVDTVFLLVQLDELARQRGARHHHHAQAGDVVRVRLEMAVERHPYRGHAGADGDALVFDQQCNVGGLQMPAAEHQSRARHDPGVGSAPAVGVEHRDHLQNRVALTQRERVRHADSVAVQEQSTVTVDNSLGIARGRGGVAHRGRRVFVEPRPRIRFFRRPSKQGFVIERA